MENGVFTQSAGVFRRLGLNPDKDGALLLREGFKVSDGFGEGFRGVGTGSVREIEVIANFGSF